MHLSRGGEAYPCLVAAAQGTPAVLKAGSVRPDSLAGTDSSSLQLKRQATRPPFPYSPSPRHPPELPQPNLVPVPIAAQRLQHSHPPELGIGVASLLHLV